jgi:methylated-DNA-[protein]-cysteine S-methyltransferase
MTTHPLTLLTMPTPAGEAHAVVTPEDGVVRLFGWLDPQDNIVRLPTALRERGVSAGHGPSEIRDAVARYGDGDAEALSGIGVSQPGGEFFQSSWRAMRGLPAGHPVTYTELAAAAGRPVAVRAAASACARNLVALIVPCHRILRRDGTLGGFFYGLEIKRALLAHEAAHSS